MSENNFVPFKDLADADQIEDFDLNKCLAGPLELRDVQTALLSYLLREINLQIWFEDDKGGSLALSLFFGINFVARADLLQMLETPLSERQVEEPKEIAALERLRKAVVAAIALRQFPDA